MSEAEYLKREIADLRLLPTPSHRSALDEVFARLFVETREFREALRPEVVVEAAPVRIEHVPPSEVRVDVPDQSQALAALTAAITELIAVLRAKETTVTVNVPDLPVQVVLPAEEQQPLEITFERGPNGAIKSATVR